MASDTTTVVMVYDDVPPSSNTNAGVGGRGHPKSVARTKRQWEGVFQMLLMAHKVPRRLARVSVTAELAFRDKRRRDADNWYFAISKPMGDALTKGGWLLDDDAERYRFERVRISQDKLTGIGPLVKARMVLWVSYQLLDGPPSPLPAP